MQPNIYAIFEGIF